MSNARPILAYALARAGDEPAAAAMLAELEQLASRQFISGIPLAIGYLGLGQHKRCLDWLEKGYQQRVWHTTLIGQDALFDPLRGVPRFDALREKVGL